MWRSNIAAVVVIIVIVVGISGISSAILSSAAWADTESSNSDSPKTTVSIVDNGVFVKTNIGIEGEFLFRYRDKTLQATPVDDDASLVLRIADVVKDGETYLYELRYIGRRAGKYDLRDHLVRIDGRPAEIESAMPVTVLSVLPEEHAGELEQIAAPELGRPWPYRTLLVVLAIVWSIPLLVWIVRRVGSGRDRAKIVPAAEPTLADQMRPLVESAVHGELSVTGKSQLERMLMTYWREELNIRGGTMSEALAQMRQHEEAGQLLGQLETWFHRPPRFASQVDVAEILRPYHQHAPIDVEPLTSRSSINGNGLQQQEAHA